MSLWLLEKLQDYSDLKAIAYKSISYSYGDLYNQVQSYKNQLSLEIKKPAIVIIHSDYSFYSIALLLSCIDLDFITVPIVSAHGQEVKDKIEASNADYILALNEEKITIKPVVEKEAENELIQALYNKNHSGLILFSSGSTGQPKAMIHDLTQLLETYRSKRNKKLSIIIFLLFDHIGGINTLFNILSMGAKGVIPHQRDVDTVGLLIEQEKVNILPASPTFLNLLLMDKIHTKYDLSSIRMITYGTEPMPESLLMRTKACFPKAKLLQTFGTSETGIAQVNSRSSTSLDIKIDDPNMEYKVVDNELWLKSKTKVLGYLNASMESFTEDGWFCTGDLVEEKEDGYLRIIGRNKEIINVGGEKVLPAEVESVLLMIGGVEDCIVYAVNNAITGQSVAVKIVKKAEINEAELKKNIRKFCFKNMERYKVPTKIVFVPQLNIGDRFKKKRLTPEVNS
jgi:acyl-coenzyme A synthetase/AMP-(fatty) acid ligase